MTGAPDTRCTAFQRHPLIARGPLWQVAPLVLAAGDGVLVSTHYMDEAERWGLAMLVRQSSLQAFMAFDENPAYPAGLGHRSAAPKESRLRPLTP